MIKTDQTLALHQVQDQNITGGGYQATVMRASTLPPVRHGMRTMNHPNQTRIMQNGPGWYWEVVTKDRDVIARGIADNHAQARADAEKATLQQGKTLDIAGRL